MFNPNSNRRVFAILVSKFTLNPFTIQPHIKLFPAAGHIQSLRPTTVCNVPTNDWRCIFRRGRFSAPTRTICSNPAHGFHAAPEHCIWSGAIESSVLPTTTTAAATTTAAEWILPATTTVATANWFPTASSDWGQSIPTEHTNAAEYWLRCIRR